MASSSADDDLVASKTEGFKVGEKKTVEEYAKLGMLGISQETNRQAAYFTLSLDQVPDHVLVFLFRHIETQFAAVLYSRSPNVFHPDQYRLTSTSLVPQSSATTITPEHTAHPQTPRPKRRISQPLESLPRHLRLRPACRRPLRPAPLRHPIPGSRSRRTSRHGR